VYAISNSGSSDYHAMQLQYRRRLHARWQAAASYTFSHAIDTASDEFVGGPPASRLVPEVNRGNADFDLRHSLHGAVTFQLPSVAWGGPALRDWQIDVLGFAQSGAPFTPTVTRDLGYGRFLFRPDVVDGVPMFLYDDAYPGGRRVNPAAFRAPTELRQGNLGRNALRALSAWQIDFALSRDIRLTQAFRVGLRAEAFNIFNHPNFGKPVTGLAAATFGQQIQMLNAGLGSGEAARGLNPTFQVGGPRSLQFSVRLTY
jgi:hypothetical protein